MKNITTVSLDKIRVDFRVLEALSTLSELRILSITVFGLQDIHYFTSSSPVPSSLRYIQVIFTEYCQFPGHSQYSAVYRMLQGSAVTLEAIHLGVTLPIYPTFITRQLEEIMEMSFLSLKCFVTSDLLESLESLSKFLERHRSSLQHFETEYSICNPFLISEMPLLESIQGICWGFSATYTLEETFNSLTITELAIDGIEVEALMAIVQICQNLRTLNVWDIENIPESRYIFEVCIFFLKFLTVNIL